MPKVIQGRNGRLTTKRERSRNAMPQKSRIKRQEFPFALLREAREDEEVFITLHFDINGKVMSDDDIENETSEFSHSVDYALEGEDVVWASRESDARNQIKRKHPHKRYIFV